MVKKMYLKLGKNTLCSMEIWKDFFKDLVLTFRYEESIQYSLIQKIVAFSLIFYFSHLFILDC
jgi:hypothetical protein